MVRSSAERGVSDDDQETPRGGCAGTIAAGAGAACLLIGLAILGLAWVFATDHDAGWGPDPRILARITGLVGGVIVAIGASLLAAARAASRRASQRER